MSQYKRLLKHCIGLLALIWASTFPAHACAEDQAYTCNIRVASVKTASVPLRDNVKIQASSLEDVKSKVKTKSTTPAALIYEVTSCVLQG